MSTELQDAFTLAAEVAHAEFATRDAADIIVPATRRVSRHRAAVRVGAGLASVAVLGGVIWGAAQVSGAGQVNVDPAAPTDDAMGGSADPNPGSTVPNNAWTTLDLAVRAHPRKQGDNHSDITNGMICNHATAADDPRIGKGGDGASATGRTVLGDCRAVGYFNGPTTTLTHWSVSASKLDHSLTYTFSIDNESPQPIAIDAGSVFMWIETDPNSPSDTAAQYSSTMVGTSMWGTSGDVTALLTSDTEPLVIAAGGDFSSSITATTGSAEGDPLAAVLASGEPYRVSLWARVHEASPSGDATYLIALGRDNNESWLLSGEGKVS